mmetsp:Transcript_25159/g.55203  ORF Transcript_25159/g.55203 Transcript_25159/m.55203 type:complete len:100 (-) Transcript_25159:1084-1383(-)
MFVAVIRDSPVLKKETTAVLAFHTDDDPFFVVSMPRSVAFVTEMETERNDDVWLLNNRVCVQQVEAGCQKQNMRGRFERPRCKMHESKTQLRTQFGRCL